MINSLLIEHGIVKGFHCNSCSGYNDILNHHCIYCKVYKGLELESLIDTVKIQIRRGILIQPMPKTEMNEELHAKFFNDEAVIIHEMDIPTLDLRIEELKLIAFEARTRLGKSESKKRELIANLTDDEREKLITRPDFNSSERSKLPKKDKSKKTAADKALENFQGLGLSDELIQEMMSKITFPKGSPENPLADKFEAHQKKIKECEEEDRIRAEELKKQQLEAKIADVINEETNKPTETESTKPELPKSFNPFE